MTTKLTGSLLAGLILVGCSTSNKDSISQTLRLVDRFPESRSSSFIGNPRDILVESGMIYVPDLSSTTIKVYNSDGRLVRSIGRSGRGPGEFSGLFQVGWLNGSLVAEDVLNRRMQFFNTDGAYSGEFAKKRAFVEFTTSDSLIFAFSPNAMNDLDLKSDSLIHSFRADGTHLNSFGSYLSMTEGIPQGLSWPRLSVNRDSLYVLFSYVPILRVYASTGALVREIQLNHPDYLSQIVKNTSKEALSNPSAPQIGFIFQDMKIHDGIIYAAVHGSTLRIDTFTLDGTFIRSLTYPSSSDSFTFFGFDIDQDADGSTWIYALIADDEPMVYRFKEVGPS